MMQRALLIAGIWLTACGPKAEPAKSVNARHRVAELLLHFRPNRLTGGLSRFAPAAKCLELKGASGMAERLAKQESAIEKAKREMERWQIWRDWEHAFHSGRAAQESHPGYGGKNDRYDELKKLVEPRLLALKPLNVRLVANFRALPGQDLPGYMMRDFEVEWSLPPNKSLELTREG